ncbi:pseudouridine synthase [Planctomicrobium sp. SH664]|uniref:pseudouridine synthase n=1 Tax=Planctomicrobium sp. SH664 TaxID=3448125 RepID=UPI003F5BFF0A
MKPMRLQRFLAQCGLGSRRECEELITSGRIEIDDQVVTQLGTSVNPQQQTVKLDGERLKLERKKYFMLNKPAGYLCTAKDPGGRPVVLDLFAEEGPRLFTVGRLDENTTGLLVVTNDGDLAQKLAHPRHRIFRYYRAQVAGTPSPEIVEQLQKGLFFTEGKFRVHSVKLGKKQKGSTWVEITMTEGQNREIRRLFARVGHKIMKLERIGFGPLRLSRVTPGNYRELRREELAELHAVLERNRTADRLEFGVPELAPSRPTRPGASRLPGGRRPGKPDPARQGQYERSSEGGKRPAKGRPATRGSSYPPRRAGKPDPARQGQSVRSFEEGERPTTGRPATRGGSFPPKRAGKPGAGSGRTARPGERTERAGGEGARKFERRASAGSESRGGASKGREGGTGAARRPMKSGPKSRRGAGRVSKRRR